MEIREMTIEQIEERKIAIVAELDNEGADLNALEEEMRSLNAEIEARKAAEAQKAEIRSAVASGEVGEVIKTVKEEKREMKTNEEIRASQEYVDAFARYLISENDAEVRSLLTENVSGSVPVPKLVDDVIRTAWDDSDILSRVKKTYFRGVLRVPFELSADDAYVHVEGTSAPTEESLTLGVVEMVPANVKKWISVSDEVIAMGGEKLVSYVYEELMKKIIDKLESLVIADVATAKTTADSDECSVENITEAPSLVTVAKALTKLCSEAKNPVVILNRATEANFIAAQVAGNFAFDPFRGLPVLYSNALTAYDSASANQAYMIVGDLNGVQVNYPEGEGVVIKYDDVSQAEKDLVKIIGRQYAAHALTACKRFTVVKKPSGASS